MKVFDWEEFVRKNNIEHIERGANVGRGELNIKCPFCSSADPSFHMGLNLTTGYWACWRNRKGHSGKSPLRLIVTLLNIPYWKARQLAGLDKNYVDPEGFDSLAAKLMREEGLERMEELQKRYLAIPKDFHLIENWGSSRRHYNYLRNERGFGDYAQQAIFNYMLLYTKDGDMRDRVVFPYVVEDDLVAWSGRSIVTSTLRYKDLPIDECVLPPKHTLYNHDCILQGGEVLCVVEGPIDTVKMDLGGKPLGVRAAGLSTNSMSDDQIWLLEEAATQFKYLVFLMDNKSSGFGAVDSMRIKQQVSHIPNARIYSLPGQFKDCGEMLIPEVEEFAAQLIKDL